MGVCRKFPGGAAISQHRSNCGFMEGKFNVSTQWLTFELGSNKFSEGLGFDHLYV
jgi:hypothetical protein